MQLLKVNDLVRVGRNYDGGYVISESLMKQSDVLLSFGINDDWSFEKDFYNRTGARCYGFDFSVNHDLFRKKGLEQIRFFLGDLVKRRKINWSRWTEARRQFGLHKDFKVFFKANQFFSYGIDARTHGQFKKLDDILEEYLGPYHDIFLKIDIEGYEFAILNDVLRNKNRFHALAIEIHGIHDEGLNFDGFIGQLQEEYYIYHVHANNYGSLEKKGGMPEVIEISCIRKDLVGTSVFYPDLSHLPIEGVDFPNNLQSADFKW